MSKKVTKAGVIPYCIRYGVLQMRFMTPSDPDYGGTKPQIAKGCIDTGETAVVTALREGIEEVGLRQSNIIQLFRVGTFVATSSDGPDYDLILFAAEVRSMSDFDTPHYETKEVSWLTMQDFLRWGRYEQREIVAAAANKIESLSTE